MKQYQFAVKLTGIARGVVTAKSKKQALSKIEKGEYDDIFSHEDEEYRELLEIDDGSEVDGE